MSTITTAAREYASRPADERFESVSALVTHALTERQASAERNYNLKDLRIVAGRENQAYGSVPATTLRLASPKGEANFTHWSFGQLCRSLGAPASYLRELPPTIAADALNFGLQDSPVGTAANLLVRAPNGRPEPTLRACTSDSYGRMYDSELYDAVQKQIIGYDPPIGDAQSLTRSDRDSFVILTNKQSVITDPSLINTAADWTNSGPDGGPVMYRGILLRNSEVGAASVTIDTILYRCRCKNRMSWSSGKDRSFRRRHIGTHVLRDVIRQIATIAREWTQQSAARDEAIIRGLISHELAATKDAVVDELRAIGYTKDQATEAYETCERKENASPRSFWGIAQGTTRNSQTTEWQDDRYLLDQLAAKVLARGAKLVAV